ncbi:hypothetical protein TNCV_3736621 [Trichonephila clavipes]|nr:hypothetical protein TNCV_3736621 [Trichonephila clavipes]
MTLRKRPLFRRKLKESFVNLTSELILLVSCAYADKTKLDNKKGTARTLDSQTPGSRTAVHVLMGEKRKKMSGAS